MTLEVVRSYTSGSENGKNPSRDRKGVKEPGRHLKFANGTKPTRVRECTPP